MRDAASIQAVLKHDRALVLAGLAFVCLLSWLYLIHLASAMPQMDMEMAMPQMRPWELIELISLFVMWSVMMVAMMAPSAAPMVLMFARINRNRQRLEQPYVRTAVFLTGYLLVWVGFSLAATMAQWALHAAALLSPAMVSTSPWLGAILLGAAGVFQWAPLKSACLQRCRSPIGFLTAEWREGARGALRMGLQHGKDCTLCCWALMALLFVGGVMNLLWVGVITMFVLIEKVTPRSVWVSRAAGSALVVWAAWVALQAHN